MNDTSKVEPRRRLIIRRKSGLAAGALVLEHFEKNGKRQVTGAITVDGESTTSSEARENVESLLERVTGVKPSRRNDMLHVIREGLKYKSFVILLSEFDTSQKQLAEILSIPPSTLSRRKKEGRLHPDESDRVARFARIRDAAVEMMDGDHEAAIHWLKTPRSILGDESPMEHAATEMGARDVEDLIGRIEHGVFS